MFHRLTAAMMLLAVPVGAQTVPQYEAAIRAAPKAQGCAFGAGGEGSEMSFSRELGMTAAEMADRSGPNHDGLTRAVAGLAERGMLSLDGTRMALTDGRS